MAVTLSAAVVEAVVPMRRGFGVIAVPPDPAVVHRRTR